MFSRERLLGATLVSATLGFAFAAPFALAAPDGSIEAEEAEAKKLTGDVEPVPGWSIKPEMKSIEGSMKQFNVLIGSLNRANKDLKDEFEKYLKNPDNKVIGSSLEKKMAAYAAQVQGEFSTVISEQDGLTANFRMLRRKLQQLAGHLGTKAGDFQDKLKGFTDDSKKQEKALIELAIKIKENPPEDPDELKKLKHDFLIKQRRFNIKSRYVKGYASRIANYQQLRKNLDKLSDLFVMLHEKFGDLMDNLSNEKQYLRDTIELQADTLRIKQIIEQGITGGDNAIKNVSAKLADLYIKVDAFGAVHDKISADLNKFVESETEIGKISDQLMKIGETPFGQGQTQDIDKSIDEFYEKSKNPSIDDDAMLGKDAPK
ncbi:hypothetical protein HY251_01375 [bacterium]|nr:hypothetical protein [bacterium]